MWENSSSFRHRMKMMRRQQVRCQAGRGCHEMEVQNIDWANQSSHDVPVKDAMSLSMTNDWLSCRIPECVVVLMNCTLFHAVHCCRLVDKNATCAHERVNSLWFFSWWETLWWLKHGRIEPHVAGQIINYVSQIWLPLQLLILMVVSSTLTIRVNVILQKHLNLSVISPYYWLLLHVGCAKYVLRHIASCPYVAGWTIHVFFMFNSVLLLLIVLPHVEKKGCFMICGIELNECPESNVMIKAPHWVDNESDKTLNVVVCLPHIGRGHSIQLLSIVPFVAGILFLHFYQWLLLYHFNSHAAQSHFCCFITLILYYSGATFHVGVKVLKWGAVWRDLAVTVSSLATPIAISV